MNTNHSGWVFPAADAFMRSELRSDGSYQRDHLETALHYVTDTSMAIDGGAHVGTWSRLMSDAFGTVIAVEPSQDTFEALVENMKTFGCLNVTCRQVALGAAPGYGSMAMDARDTARRNTGGRYVSDGLDVAITTIDDWNLPRLGFLKLDVEGYEPFALLGAVATLTRCQPIVLFENKNLWRRFGEGKHAPARVLQNVGYRNLERVGCDEIWGPK